MQLDTLRTVTRRWWPGFLAGVLALAGTMALYAGTARPVTVIVDGQAQRLSTHADTVAEVLRDLGLRLSDRDRVYPSPKSDLAQADMVVVERARPVTLRLGDEIRVAFTVEDLPANILADLQIPIFPGDRLVADGYPLDPAEAVAWRPQYLRLSRARLITLRVDGQVLRLLSAAPTLGEALWENGIRLFEGDRLTPPPDTPLDGPVQAVLARSRPVTVLADGRTVWTRVVAETVGEALAQAGVALQGLDYAVPDLEAPVSEDGSIRVVRVREEVVIDQEAIPFETLYEPQPDLEIDQQRVLDPGSFGILARRVRVRYEDGVEVARVYDGEWVAREPEPRVVGYGTKIVVRSLVTPDGPIEYWRAVQMWATSYSPSRAGLPPDHPWFGITASGKRLTKGLVAIDRSLIPFGTRMYVPGYGFAEAADTGGGVRGRWIDLGYDDDNYVPWARWVTVYFLTPVPPPENIVWVFPP